jgi:hypothetical protein
VSDDGVVVVAAGDEPYVDGDQRSGACKLEAEGGSDVG